MTFSEDLQDQIDTLYAQSSLQIDLIGDDPSSPIMLAATLGAAVGIISALIPKQSQIARNFRADIMAVLSDSEIDTESCMALQDDIFSVIQANHNLAID